MRAPTSLASELLARLPTMTEDERRLGLEIYRQLVHGAPVSRAALAEALPAPITAVDELLGHTNLKSLTYADNDGRIVGFGGLAISTMAHQFKVDGRTLYTWCAWDSLFIPNVLGMVADVESPAPGNGARIRLRVGPSGVQWVEPNTAVMSFLVPTAETFRGDALKAMVSFCHYIFFFPEHDTAAAWTTRHPDTTVISVAEAFELGRKMVEARWR